MYRSVEITLNGKSGEPLSFRYDYDNEIVAQIILPQDCAESCTNIQDLMAAIDSGVICDGDESWTLRNIIEDFHNEEEEERYDLDNHLEECDKFVQNALPLSEFQQPEICRNRGIWYRRLVGRGNTG